MMNFGDYQSKTSTPSYNYYPNARNDNIGYTSGAVGSHQYWDDSVGYREEEIDTYHMETKQIFSKSLESFEHVDHCTSSPYATSIGHFQNQNVQTTKDCNRFEDGMHFRLQQNSTRNCVQQISSKYSEKSHNTSLKNTFNNYCNDFTKRNLPKAPDYAVPVCFDAQISGGNDFNSAQRVEMQSRSYEENLSTAHSLLYEHNTFCASGVDAEPELDQPYNANTFPPVHNNSIWMQHNIRPTPMAEKSIPFGVGKSNFNIYPHLQTDKSENENFSSVRHVGPYNHHWYGLGMGRMKMECWETIVFRRKHSVYINAGLMSQSIGLSRVIVKRLMGRKATSERMTQLEISILRYIKCVPAKSLDTGLIPLVYFLNTLHAELNDEKPNQAQIKSTIKAFIEKLHSGFVPAVSNIPHDLSDFFQFNHFSKTSIQDGSKNSLKQFKIVSHLVLKEKSFSLIEYDGDFYMHLGEMVSNGLFPSTNLVRRKIRKMHIKTKWLDSVESKYLNLSQEQELIRFTDLRILCGVILYLHPNMQTDLLQMFSAMDLPDHILTANNHLGSIKYTQNCLPIENTARKELQYPAIRPHSISSTADNQKQSILTESLQTSLVGNPQIEVNSEPWMKNLQSVNPGVKMEMLAQNYDTDNDIRNESHSTIMGKNVSTIPERYVLREERMVPTTSFLSEEPDFMDSVVNSKAEMDILDVAFKELLDEAADNCPTSSLQILPRSDGSSTRDNCMTPEIRHDDQDVCDLTCNNQGKSFDCYPASISLSENNQIEKGNDKPTNCANQNDNYVEQFLKSKSIYQIPEVFQKRFPFNNSIADKASQMEHSQLTDSTVNTNVANLSPVTSNYFDSPYTAKQSKPETFAGSGINASIINRLGKKQTDPQKCSQFSNTSKSLYGSNIDQYDAFKSKYSNFDKNQSKQLLANESNATHSHILPPPVTINAKKSEISTSSTLSNSNQVCDNQIRSPFFNTAPLDNGDKLLYTLPHLTLPMLNNEQKGVGSLEEPEKDTFSAQKNYPSTMSFSKSPYCSSNFSQSKIWTDQDCTLEDELSPSIPHCEMEHVMSRNNVSTNSSLLTFSDDQLPTSNTLFQSLSSLPTLGSFEKFRNSPRKTGIHSGNKSLDYNKPTASDCVSFQAQKSCHDDLNLESQSKSVLMFSESFGETVPIVRNVMSARVTSCSETFTISSPTTTFCGSPCSTLRTNPSNSNPAENLEQFIKPEKLPESREVALDYLPLRPGITCQKSQIYKQEATCQPNVPCITSTVIQRSYKEESFEKLSDEKPIKTDDQKERRWSQVTSNIQDHTLEIASMAAIDTLVMETNWDISSNSVFQNVKTKDTCSLALPCFEMSDTHRISLSPTLKTSVLSESGVKEAKYTSTDAFVEFNPAKKNASTALVNSNEQNSPSLIPNTDATKKHNADSFCTNNNQFHKEISDTVYLDSQNYQYHGANYRHKAKMEPDATKSCIMVVVEKEDKSVKSNSTRVKRFPCQKTVVQDEGNCTFSLGYQPMQKTNSITYKSEGNTKCAVFNKHEKPFHSCSGITSISMGSMKYASLNTETKAQNICKPDNLDVLLPSVRYQATTAKQMSVLDLLNITQLNVTGNRLHLDVAITDRARKIFQNKSKDNPVQLEKIFLQQLANDCCQFAKCWFGVFNSHKNVCTNPGYQSDVAARDRTIQMPPISDSTIIACKCSKQLCHALKVPESETSKGKISKTSDIFHNVIEESPGGSNQSDLVLFSKAKDHNIDIGSSKLCKIESGEQMPQKMTQNCESGFKNKSAKRKILCPENGKLKKKKFYKTQQ